MNVTNKLAILLALFLTLGISTASSGAAYLIEVNNPDGGEYLSEGVSIEWNVSDQGQNFAGDQFEIQYLQDGSATTIADSIENGGENTFSYDWDSTDVSNSGNYRVRVISGNINDDSDSQFTIDNKPPSSVDITSPSSTQYKENQEALTVSYNFQEAHPDEVTVNFVDDSGIVSSETFEDESDGSGEVTVSNLPSGEGKYNIELAVKDRAENQASTTETNLLTVDNTAPSMEEIDTETPIYTQPDQDNDISFTYTEENPETAEITVGSNSEEYNGQLANGDSQTETKTFSSSNLPAEEGTYDLTVSLTDRVEKTGSITATGGVVVDGSNPSVSGLTHEDSANQGWDDDTSVKFDWTGSDDGPAGISHYEVKISNDGDTSDWEKSTELQTSEYTYTASDGETVAIQVTPVDRAENPGDSKEVTGIQVDTGTSLSEVTAPDYVNEDNRDAFTISGDSSETNVESIDVTATSGETQLDTASPTLSDESFTTNLDLTGHTLSDGDQVSVEVTITDQAGNQETETRTATWDTTVPNVNSVDVSSDLGGPSEKFTVTADVSDSTSGVGTVTATVTNPSDEEETTLDLSESDGTYEGTFTPDSDFTSDPIADGAYTAEVQATDEAGNTEQESDTASFEIDSTPPSITDETLEIETDNLASDIANEDDTLQVHAEVSDSVAGVSSVTADISGLATDEKSPLEMTDQGDIDGDEDNEYTATFTLAEGTTDGDASVDIEAKDNAQNPAGPFSTNAVSVDNEVPASPQELQATSVSGGEISLSWNSVEASDLSNYAVYHREGETGDFSEIATTGSDTTSYTTTSSYEDGTTEYFKVSAIDDAENEGPKSDAASAVANADSPIVESATVLDQDNDGNVDAAELTFNEPVDGTTFEASEWTIGGKTVDRVAGTSNDDETVTLELDDGNEVSGTETAEVTYTESTDSRVKDLAGNTLADISEGDITETDGAEPVATSGSYHDTNDDGTIDEVKVTFSESVDYEEFNSEDWTVTPNDLADLSVERKETVNGDTVVLQATAQSELTGVGRDESEPVVSYNPDGSGKVKDGENEGVTSSVTLTDEAAPTFRKVTTDNSFLTPKDTVGRIFIDFTEDLDSQDSGEDGDGDISVDGDEFSVVEENGLGTTDLGSTVYGTVDDDVNRLHIRPADVPGNTGATPVIKYDSSNGQIFDPHGNNMDIATSEPAEDGARPAVTDSNYRDVNSDGKVDTINVEFSEKVDESTFNNQAIAKTWSTGGCDLGGSADIGFAVTYGSDGTGALAGQYQLSDSVSDQAQNSEINLEFTGNYCGSFGDGGVYDFSSDKTHYSPASLDVLAAVVEDLGGNENFEVTSSRSMDDEAAPLVESSETVEGNNISVTFTEDIKDSTVTKSSFDVSGYSVSTVEEDSGQVSIHLSSEMGAGETPQVTVPSGDGVEDVAGNVFTGSFTPEDGVKPQVTSIETYDVSDGGSGSEADGSVNGVKIHLSEAVQSLETSKITFKSETKGQATLSEDGRTVTVTLDEPLEGTSATPTVDLDAGAVVDESGNVISATERVSVDGAAPVVLHSEIDNAASTSSVTYVDVTFSETVTAENNAQVTLEGDSGVLEVDSQRTGETIQTTYNHDPNNDDYYSQGLMETAEGPEADSFTGIYDGRAYSDAGADFSDYRVSSEIDRWVGSYSGDSNSSTYTSLRKALSEAQDGEKVLVEQGTYTNSNPRSTKAEYLVDSSITLVAENSPTTENPVVIESGTGQGIRVAASDATVKGFKITNDDSAGIYLTSAAANANVSYNWLQDKQGDDPYKSTNGVRVEKRSAYFTNNHIEGFQHGVLIAKNPDSSGHVEIKDNSFINMGLDGIYVVGKGSGVTQSGHVFTGNLFKDVRGVLPSGDNLLDIGGAILLNEDTAQIENLEIRENRFVGSEVADIQTLGYSQTSPTVYADENYFGANGVQVTEFVEAARNAGQNTLDRKVNTLRMNLQSGSNLVSFPINQGRVQVDEVTSEVDGATVDTVWTYSNGQWKELETGADEHYFRGGRGYLFNMKSSGGTLAVNVDHTFDQTVNEDGPTSPISYNLSANTWNLIGSYEEFDQGTETALKSLETPAGNDKYSFMSGSSPSEIETGDAYWAFMTGDGGYANTH